MAQEFHSEERGSQWWLPAFFAFVIVASLALLVRGCHGPFEPKGAHHGGGHATEEHSSGEKH
ncbi:MAG: hypothetical protein MUF12_00565 [Sediminibacterium sp.]|jgi:hypothetical protein|nr:hypothetical protein [Hydrotalea sp.]MCU0336328.1 hypothetical protein [Sediminibacterium sp.]